MAKRRTGSKQEGANRNASRSRSSRKTNARKTVARKRNPTGMNAVEKAAAKKAAARTYATKHPPGTTKVKVEEGGDCGRKIRCKSLTIDGTRYRTRLNRKFEKRASWEKPNPKRVTSVIPGTILKINVKEGQAVRMGDQLLVLEAMKMKNRIMVHHEGTVKTIHVSEGERVAKNSLMIELE